MKNRFENEIHQKNSNIHKKTEELKIEIFKESRKKEIESLIAEEILTNEEKIDFYKEILTICQQLEENSHFLCGFQRFLSLILSLKKPYFFI